VVEVGSEQSSPWSQNLTEHSLTIYVENAKWKAQNEICRRLWVYSFSVLNFYPPIEKYKITTRTTIKPKQWQRKMETNNHLTKGAKGAI